MYIKLIICIQNNEIANKSRKIGLFFFYFIPKYEKNKLAERMLFSNYSAFKCEYNLIL